MPTDRGNNRSSQSRCDHLAQSFKPYFSAQDYITGDYFRVGYCRRCGLHVTSPVPSEAEIAKYYPPAYYGSGRRFAHVVEWMLDIIYRYRVWEIERHQPPGKALDIGCGRGLLLHKLRMRGWDVRGTELSEEAAKYARNVLGLPVTTESLQDAGFPDEEFDLVILWHVLEHMHSPRDVLREVSRILKPGGRLLLATPNFGSWEARWGREHWFHLNVPGHLTHFTPRTLKRLLDEERLQIAQRSFFSTEYDFFSFVQTALNKLGLRPNRLYNILRTPAAKVEGHAERGARTRSRLRAAWEDLAVLACAPPLLAASVVYAPLAAAFRKGATIALIAAKPIDGEISAR
ncbi:MAG TPA: class I SAM-dependent methyltransferase [Chloroflexia bacterium]|nr:class I SAM-dependent methyltransferase [Chloroflexia bacterium]